MSPQLAHASIARGTVLESGLAVVDFFGMVVCALVLSDRTANLIRDICILIFCVWIAVKILAHKMTRSQVLLVALGAALIPLFYPVWKIEFDTGMETTSGKYIVTHHVDEVRGWLFTGPRLPRRYENDGHNLKHNGFTLSRIVVEFMAVFLSGVIVAGIFGRPQEVKTT